VERIAGADATYWRPPSRQVRGPLVVSLPGPRARSGRPLAAS